MPCIIGIDEAGYGPNLGPFVMTAVAAQVPDADVDLDFWNEWQAVVRRHTDKDDGRLLVADSKIVYAGGNLHALELGVRALLGPFPAEQVVSLAHFLQWCCPAGDHQLTAESWYVGDTGLPVAVPCDMLEALARTCAKTCIGLRFRTVIVCPTAFNELIDHHDSKGAVLGHCLARLLAWHPEPDEAAPLRYIIDKHGGRNYYASMLQHAIGDGMVVAETEGAQCSTYRVLGLPREMRLTFQPRADQDHFCVALASMVSKYLREVLMSEFNRFWLQHVPGLKPTAGYPGDAARFYEAIRPAAKKLRIAQRALWRER
jgi:ribonuclease HII